MGKPFAAELAKLPQTALLVEGLPLEELPKHLAAAYAGPVILIGAGGSFSAAEFGRQLFDQRGVIAQASTPLELLQSRAQLRGVTVVIFSARGNNKDVLAAFQAACDREASRIIVVCASLNNKLARLVSVQERAFFFGFALPSGRDGYLATNSLIATCLVLARAFDYPHPYSEEIEDLLQQGRQAFKRNFANNAPGHYVLLYSGWGHLAALDLESKLSEAGIAGSMLSDYRHFAHGRHNWLDKQGHQSAVITFSTPEDKRLAEATVKHFPPSIRICGFHTLSAGSAGGLSLLLETFGFASAAGEKAGIDPGRPGVPAYGSKIYHIGPRAMTATRQLEKRALSLSAGVDRKLAAARMHERVSGHFLESGKKFLDRLYLASFGALVTDFDGTILPSTARNGPIPKSVAKGLIRLLRAEIPVYLATGRGDSAHCVLRDAFPKEFWKYLHIGYFNGAFCLPLSDAEEFSSRRGNFTELDSLEKHLRSSHVVSQHAEIKNKRWQISLQPREGAHIETLVACLHEELAMTDDHSIRMVVSSHSIDLIPESISKFACLRLARSAVNRSLQILAIGDCGAYPGNDFELLRHPFSLSVNTVSTDPESCWNFLPTGISHSRGMETYLSQFVVEKRTFRFMT